MGMLKELVSSVNIYVSKQLKCDLIFRIDREIKQNEGPLLSSLTVQMKVVDSNPTEVY